MGAGAHNNKPKARAARILDVDRALRMQAEGAYIKDIAKALGCSVGKAWNLTRDARLAMPAKLAEERTRDIVEMHQAIIDTHFETHADKDSAKVIQDSHKLVIGLLGLDAPRKTELTVTAATPATARRIMSELFPGSVGPGAESDTGAADAAGPEEGSTSE